MATNQAVRELMFRIAGDPVMLLETVAGGAQKFRIDLLRNFRGLAVDETLADKIFYFFCKRVEKEYGSTPASQVLDAVEIVSPPTEKEIEDAWVHDWSHSDPEAVRQFYKDEPGECITVRES